MKVSIPKRTVLSALVIAVIGAVSAEAATAGPNPTVPTQVTVLSTGGGSFRANRFVKDTLRYAKDSYTVRSGGKLTFTRGPGDLFPDPHTLTVANAAEVPHSALQVDTCKACSLANGNRPTRAHPHGVPFVDIGKRGFDGRGDSLAIPPVSGVKVTVNVTAKAGTTLHFFCVIHPGMQAVLHVK